VPQQLRYEGSQLDDVLERVRDEHGPSARIVSADLARTKGLAGFFARETYQVTVELDPPADVRTVRSAPPADPASAEPPPPEFRETPTPAPAPAPAPVSAPANAPEFARLLADMVEDPSSEIAAPSPTAVTAPPAAGPTSAVAPTATAPAVPTVTSAEDDSRPRVVTLSEAVDQSPVSLCDLVGQLGQLIQPAAPTPNRGTVAIVGARADAVEVAVALAQTQGRAPSDVLVAAPTDSGVTPRTVAAIVAESGRRRTQRGLVGPVIVAVAIAPGADGERWATDTVSALDPSQVRLAVGGWRPIERTVQHLAALRSVVAVDALDLVELEGAASPEQFLRMGVPVGTIDGGDATATAWAALLLDCGRAAAVVEAEIVLAPAHRDTDVDFRAPSVPTVHDAPPVMVAQAGPAVARGPVPAVFPRVAVPVRR
jgi:hypothetical protein